MAKEDNTNKNVDAELRRQRRLITMLLNRERRNRNNTGNNANNQQNKKADKYQKDIEKSNKKIASLLEEEIKLNKELSRLSREAKKIAKREADLQELANHIQNEANTLSQDELRVLQQEYDVQFEQLTIDKDNLLLNQRSLAEDLKENRNEQKRYESIIKNSEKLQKEIEDMHETMEEQSEALDNLGDKFDGLTELITAWNIADIKNSLEDDAASSRDLYRELANKMNRSMDDVMAEIKPMFKEQKKLYNDVFTSTEYLEALNAIYDSGQKNVEIATEMAGTMAAMDKTLGVSADSLENVYTFLDASELKTLSNNLAGINDLQLDNVNIEDLANSIDDLAPVLGKLSQDSQDSMLQMLATMEHYSMDTSNFVDTLNRVMKDEISASERAEVLGAKGFKYYNALQSGDRAALESAVTEMFSDIQAGMSRSTLKAYYGDLLDDDMITKIQKGEIKLDDFAKTYQNIGEAMSKGSLEDMTKTVSDNLPFLSKIYNELVSGSVIEDFFQSDLWDNFGFGFQYFGAKLIEKFGGNLLQSGGNVLKNIWGWLTGGSMGTTITNALNTAWTGIKNFIKSPIDDIAASLGSSGIMGTLSTIAGYISEVLVILGIFDQGKATWDIGKEIIEGNKTGDYSGIQAAMEESWIYKGATWLEKKLRKSGTSKLEALVGAADSGGTLKEVKYIDDNGNVATRYETSHAGGLSYVPYDGYQATLHKGEKVLTSEEAKNYGLSERLFNLIKDIKEEMLVWHKDSGKVKAKAKSQYSAFNNGTTSFTNASGTYSPISNFVDTVKDKVKEFIEKAKDTFGNLSWDEISEKAKDLWSNTKEFASTTWDSVKDKVKTGWSNFIDGSHKSGLDYVPKDGYVAELHKGERVLTAGENKLYNAQTYYDSIDQNAKNSMNLLGKITDAGIIEQAARQAESYRNAFYQAQNPVQSTTPSTGTTDPLVSTGDYVKDVWTYLNGSLGYSKQATAGILGNMYQESGVNPTRIQGNGKGPAAGICQWENYNTKSARWKGLYDFAKGRGKDWTDLESQLLWLDYEMQGGDSTTKMHLKNKVGGYEAFKALTNVDTATRVFEESFERAGKPNMERRYKKANEYYNQLAAYEQGTPWVPDTQLALLHKGEAVVPAEINPFNTNKTDTTLTTDNGTTIINDYDDIVEVIKELKIVVKNATEFLGRKLERTQKVEIKQDTSINNTLNTRYKERQHGARSF